MQINYTYKVYVYVLIYCKGWIRYIFEIFGDGYLIFTISVTLLDGCEIRFLHSSPDILAAISQIKPCFTWIHTDSLVDWVYVFPWKVRVAFCFSRLGNVPVACRSSGGAPRKTILLPLTLLNVWFLAVLYPCWGPPWGFFHALDCEGLTKFFSFSKWTVRFSGFINI